MSRVERRGLDDADADRILAALSTRQHLQPHRSLGEVLSAVQRDLGFCPKAAQTAVRWLRLDGGRAVGRLRRSELIQLSRSIHRFWRQTMALDAVSYHPL